MGSTQSTWGQLIKKKEKMRAVLAVLLAVLVATYAVTEVQELGNDVQTTSLEKSASTATEESDDDLGEGLGRRASFLATQGSFTLSAGSNRAGNDEEDEDELGEGVGRRASFLSTRSSFTLTAGSNRAGNDEEDEE